jgi:dolichol-phosphate mannosyltransferase
MKLSVISPTFDEAQNVGPLLEQLTQTLRGIDYEILIVDDNSPDLTWFVAEQAARRDPRVRVLRRLQNPGLGVAVIDGFNAAQGEAVACIDADLQHDPSILPRMLEELGRGSDVVVGSRYVAGGGIEDWNWLRRTESRIATRLAKIFLGANLKDPMSGYFLMWRRDFARVQVQLNGKGFKILLEILGKLHPANIREVPYTFRPRTAGKSKLSSKVVLQYLGQLCLLSKVGRLCSDRFRFLKFAVAGSIGIVINLVMITLILKLTNVRGWQASAVASLAANLNNYILNNYWTFSDQLHRGWRAVKGYFSYLMMTAVGLLVTTTTYAVLTGSLARLSLLRNPARPFSSFTALFCQLIAIVFGTFFNYRLNKAITWSKTARPQTSQFRLQPRTFVARLLGR